MNGSVKELKECFSVINSDHHEWDERSRRATVQAQQRPIYFLSYKNDLFTTWQEILAFSGSIEQKSEESRKWKRR